MNMRNAQFLLLMTLLFVLIGTLLDRAAGRVNSQFAWSFLIVSLAMNGFFYFFSDSIVLRTAGAKPLPRERAPRLYGLAERLAKRAGIPRPALFWVPDETLNAFATGRDPRHGAVVVTLGLLRGLDEREVEAVLAHEFAHVRNYDTLAASVLAAMAGTLAYVSRGLLPFAGRSASLRRLGAGLRLGLFTMIILVAAPFLALLVKFAASRSREFEADEAAAELTGGPEGLCSALARIGGTDENAASVAPGPGLLVLMTFSPKAASRLIRLLRTHPPIKTRIARLQRLSPC
jgi:heat shock protein HtpX